MTRSAHDALISIGSNVDPEVHIPRVLAWFEARFEDVGISPAYRSAAVGGAPGQPPFVNLAVRIRSDLLPRALREVTRRAEDVCGRRRTEDRYAPRTMDADLVWHDSGARHFGTWQLPDPQLRQEAFVLVPSADVAPELVDPVTGRTLRQMCDGLDADVRGALVRIDL